MRIGYYKKIVAVPSYDKRYSERKRTVNTPLYRHKTHQSSVAKEEGTVTYSTVHICVLRKRTRQMPFEKKDYAHSMFLLRLLLLLPYLVCDLGRVSTPPLR